MTHSQIIAFSIALGLLILLSGFFSAAETALMSINRYRLRHRARMKKRSAILILRLLQRPDRLLGMILIGNSFSNIMASALTTLLAVHFFGEGSVLIASLLLTFVVLIFSEVAPKTLAVLHPDTISRWSSIPIFLLLKLFYPLVWLINTISNGLLRLFNIKVIGHASEPLSREELRSVVYETSGRMSAQYQTMLLGILDLNKVTVNDVMVPRHEIIGIDLESDWSEIQHFIQTVSHDWIPLYRENINQTVGMLHLRDLMQHIMRKEDISKNTLLKIMTEPYFIPENTTLNVQLLNFQRQRKSHAFVVDEYGEIQGLITLGDILEEIVGEFATNMEGTSKIIQLQLDGSYLIDGSMTLREINRLTSWDLPTNGPRTLSGLIIEYLEAIPKRGVCVRIHNFPIEIVQVMENRVKLAKVYPKLAEETHLIDN